MRYYRIEIAGQDGSLLQQWTSRINGVIDPGALDIELDVPVTYFDTPQGGGYVRLWGVSLAMVAQATEFNPPLKGGPGKIISIYGGMAKGLPLANPAQAALLASGMIQQAFGNWVGVDMTLDILFTAGNINPSVAQNFTVQWAAGTAMSVMIANTLKTVFPDYQQDIKIAPGLVLNHDETGFNGSIFQFASYVAHISSSIQGSAGTDNAGVRIVLREKTFVVRDQTSKTNPIQIDFNDLIGQVTWRSTASITLMCVMRGDLQVGDLILMPPGQATTTAQSQSQYRQGSSILGSFVITSIRHVGRFRNPDGQAWATIIEASLKPAQPAS